VIPVQAEKLLSLSASVLQVTLLFHKLAKPEKKKPILQLESAALQCCATHNDSSQVAVQQSACSM